MLVTFQVLNNITTHRILYACYGILSDSFWHQTISDFDKLIEQNGNKNIAKIATPIFLIIIMHIGLTKLLEDGATTTNYDSEGRLCRESQGLDWGDDKEIEEVVADARDDKDKAEDPQEKNKRLKR